MDSCCSPIFAEEISEETATEVAGILAVLADPARLRILNVLAACDEVCVCELTEPLELAQPTVSHHMKLLREAGFVAGERRGKWVYYRLLPERVRDLRRALAVPARQ